MAPRTQTSWKIKSLISVKTLRVTELLDATVPRDWSSESSIQLNYLIPPPRSFKQDLISFSLTDTPTLVPQSPHIMGHICLCYAPKLVENDIIDFDKNSTSYVTTRRSCTGITQIGLGEVKY